MNSVLPRGLPSGCGSDNFDWRDLRGLGRMLGSMFFSPGPEHGVRNERVAASLT
jgi:hypothetical protein